MTNKYLYFKAKHEYKNKIIWFRTWKTKDCTGLEVCRWEHIHKKLPYEAYLKSLYPSSGQLLYGLENDCFNECKPLSKKEELLCKLLYE